MKTPVFVLLFLTGFCSAVFSAADLRLEGVVVDPDKPAEALAVINGQPLKAGDLSEGYKVLSIDSETAVLENIETGEEKVLKLKAADPKPAVAPSSEPDAASPQPSNGPFLKNLWEAPGRAVNRVYELKGLRELAIIHNAAVVYFSKHQYFPDDLEALVEAKLLPASYQTGLKDPYQFRLLRAAKPEDFGIHADPLRADSKLRHFFVGVDAVIREESGRPANRASLPHDY